MKMDKKIKKRPPAYGTGLRLAIYQGEDQVGSPDAILNNLSKLEKVLIIAKKYVLNYWDCQNYI